MAKEIFDILILGNSAAGLSALKKIRSISKIVTVGIIDREDCPSYSRVMTPYYIGKRCPRSGLFLVGEDFYHNLGVKTFFGNPAKKIDVDSSQVILENSRCIKYKNLLISCGAEATRPEFFPDRVTVLRHIKDADKIISNLENIKSITAVGAGLVSIPVLSHVKKVPEKNLILSSDRIFSRVVDKDAAEIVESYLIKSGVNIYKYDNITSFKENGHLELSLKSGKKINTDFVLVGKGVVPNIAVVKDTPIKCNYGILIDDYCRTNIQNIYAAGDIAEGKDFVTGNMTIQGNWITAVDQGEIAALNILGNNVKYEGSIKNNTTEVFGVDMAVVGYFDNNSSNVVVYHNKQQDIFRKIFLDESKKIIGVTMVGNTNDAGLYYNMIKTREKFNSNISLSKSQNYSQKLFRIG